MLAAAVCFCWIVLSRCYGCVCILFIGDIAFFAVVAVAVDICIRNQRPTVYSTRLLIQCGAFVCIESVLRLLLFSLLIQNKSQLECKEYVEGEGQPEWRRETEWESKTEKNERHWTYPRRYDKAHESAIQPMCSLCSTVRFSLSLWKYAILQLMLTAMRWEAD